MVHHSRSCDDDDYLNFYAEAMSAKELLHHVRRLGTNVTRLKRQQSRDRWLLFGVTGLVLMLVIVVLWLCFG